MNKSTMALCLCLYLSFAFTVPDSLSNVNALKMNFDDSFNPNDHGLNMDLTPASHETPARTWLRYLMRFLL